MDVCRSEAEDFGTRMESSELRSSETRETYLDLLFLKDCWLVNEIRVSLLQDLQCKDSARQSSTIRMFRFDQSN